MTMMRSWMREWKFLALSLVLLGAAYGRFESRTLASNQEDYFGAPPITVTFDEGLPPAPAAPLQSPRLVPSALT